MNAPAQTAPPAAAFERPYPYEIEGRDWTLFFNGEPMPRHAQLWEFAVKPLLGVTCDDPVGWPDVVSVVWGLETVGGVESCAPAIFVYAVQELLLCALEQQDRTLACLRANPNVPAPAEEVLQGLIEGAFQMRNAVLQQKMAYWSVGYEEWELPALRHEMEAATELPVSHMLPPHQRKRLSWLKILVQVQAGRFHQLAQSGTLPKEMRRRLHNVRVPDDDFLRLIL